MDREEYLAAVAQAAKWAEEYYDNDEASVTDYEYDMHMQKIKKVEAEHPDWVVAMSPTQHVGGSQGKSTFAKVQHEVAMLSIQDVFTPEEVTAFTDQYRSKRREQRTSLSQRKHPLPCVVAEITSLMISCTK